ncbi:SRPBCC domain-containing protein [Demetria terragena]|uniref:SRPBCC domain-containing protein n=1 Tax=Demetria terragena TaxID=63959 RepID=UPI000364C692|nr:SRPBCC domain-containing protein [Demetria terragena]
MGDDVILSYDLPCPAQRAFVNYVDDIGSWWPGHVNADPSRFDGLYFEPWVGGRLNARYQPDEEVQWGTIVRIEPAVGIVHTFSLPHRSSAQTTVTLSFSELDTGSRLTFRHTPWNGIDALGQTKFGEWPLILGHYVELVRASSRRV